MFVNLDDEEIEGKEEGKRLKRGIENRVRRRRKLEDMRRQRSRK
jgi:hypothetical protein